jgi:hypothetical protein
MSTATGGHTGRAIYSGLTAAGTNQATALQLAGRGDSVQEITTVAASTGVMLPPTILPMRVEIVNQGSSTLSIYPQLGGSIDNGTANAAVTLAAGKAAIYEASSLTNWYTVSTTAAGGGTVTSVAAGTGLAGGTITTTGTVSLATIADKSVLGNTSGGTAAPAGVTLSAMIDEAIGSTQGDILYRGAGAWSVLPPGSAGQLLESGGASANPSWGTVSGSGINQLTGDITTPALSSGATAAFFAGQTNVITPASFSTERDNWSPTGWLSGGAMAANCIRFTATAYCDITGLAAPTSGDLEGVIVTLENAAGSGSNFPVRLVASSGSSSAGNKFLFPGNVFLAPGESLVLKYDNTQAGWRELISHRDVQAGYYGSGSDGPLNISSGTTTLTRDMYYSNVTISGTAVLAPNGFRVFVSEMLDISGAQAGAIAGALSPGGNGGATGTAGSAGTASKGTIPTTPIQQGGSAGGAGTLTNGGNGTVSGNSTTIVTQQAGNGGAGGTGSGGTAGTGGTGATPASSTSTFGAYGYSTNSFVFNNANVLDFFLVTVGGASGGGGSGDNSSVLGGGGGGSGNGGQFIWIAARFINRGSNSTAAIIQSRGSTGGNGGTPTTGAAGGGGGGAGGNGGAVVIYYGYLLGSTITGAIDVSSGAGGNGGGGTYGTGTSGGTGGYAGAPGVVFTMNLTTGVLVPNTSGGARAAGTAGTGTSGGPGHGAVSYQINL